MDLKVFYAWQGDLPPRVTRNLIRDAAKAACEQINQKHPAWPKAILDEATIGVPGMCDIPNAILKKIDECDVFLPDLTFIGKSTSGDRVSNPNVLFELGYAAHAKGFEQILAVMNVSYGGPEDQMFDTKRRWAVRYELKEDSNESEIAKARKALTSTLQDALELIVVERILPAVKTTTLDRFKLIRDRFEERLRSNDFGGLSEGKSAIAICVVPEQTQNIDYSRLQTGAVPPLGLSHTGWDQEFHEDSVVFFQRYAVDQARTSFVRYGATEVTTDGVTMAADQWHLTRPGFPNTFAKDYVSSADLEKIATGFLRVAFPSLQQLGVRLPWRVGMSLLGVKGFHLLAHSEELSPRACNKDDLICEPVVFDAPSQFATQQTIARVLKPSLDFVWRAFGYPESRSRVD